MKHAAIIGVVGIATLLVGAYAVFRAERSLSETSTPGASESSSRGWNVLRDETLSERIREGSAPPPVFTEEVRARLSESKGFDVLISYTDQGFQPAKLKVPRNTVVRFTNNASIPLLLGGVSWSASCAQGGACEEFSPMDFREVVFSERGTWSVSNLFGGAAKSLSIVVE